MIISSPSQNVRTAVVLIAFGSPKELTYKAMQTHTGEVLADRLSGLFPKWLSKRVCSSSFFSWKIQNLLHQYKAIWTAEGAPLRVQSEKLCCALSDHLPEDCSVALAMQHGEFLIENVLQELEQLQVEHVVFVPLFPFQTTSTTKQSVQRAFKSLLAWKVVPQITCITEFYKERTFIELCAQKIVDAKSHTYDHVVFSFHDVPAHFPEYVDYIGHCEQSARSIAIAAGLDHEHISIAYHSEFEGRGSSKPSLKGELLRLLSCEKKKVLVSTPGLLIDSIETLGDIAGEHRALFIEKGGDRLGIVTSFNDDAPWVEMLSQHIKKRIGIQCDEAKMGLFSTFMEQYQTAVF